MIKALRSVMRFRPVELDPVERRLRTAADVADLRMIARRRLPRGCFDYIDGAAEDELSRDRNIAAFRHAEFRPRVLRDVADVDPSTSLLGRDLPLPLVIAPIGFTRVASSGGELDVARAAARRGVPFTLSNHGGRQLDGAPAILELVRPVADAVGDRTEIICDGGIRRGSDIVKAVALGARACMSGRAILYGLGAAGERGVEHVLSLLDAGVRRTMALTGRRRVAELGPDLVRWRSKEPR